MEGAGGKGMRKADLLKYGALVVLVVQNSSLALTMRYSRARGGDMYLSRSVQCARMRVRVANRRNPTPDHGHPPTTTAPPSSCRSS